MTRNTHLATGIAVSLAAVMPPDFLSLAVCICAAALGSTIPDIDVSSSKPRKELNTIVGISITSIVVLIALELIFHIGIYEKIESEVKILRILLGFTLFLLLGLFGTKTKHRTFTHSIVGVLIFSASICLAFPSATVSFTIAMTSHILLDFLNKKRVKLFYPLKKWGISFNLCTANGTANKVICVVSTLIILLELLYWLILIL